MVAQAPPPPVFEPSGNPAFDEWRDDFARRAVARGRDPAVLGRLLSGITPDERVIELDQRQPEFVSPVWDYVNNRVTERRINDGRALRAEIGPTLAAVEAALRRARRASSSASGGWRAITAKRR